MTYHSLTLNFDSEVDIFDCLQSIMYKNDDLDGPSGLEVVRKRQDPGYDRKKHEVRSMR